MTSGENDLDLLWKVLETQDVRQGRIRVHGTGVVLPHGEVLVAIDPAGRRHVLMPLADDSAFAQDTATQGVHITRRPWETDSGTASFVDIECRLAHLNSVFVTLAQEMLDAAVANPARPGPACRAVLDRWRELLASERSPLLSEERTVGLLAELLVVRAVLEHDELRRVDLWAGPSGATHDLRRAGHAIEVKGTLVREGKFVQIHGVDQLTPPEGGTLHLAWHRFERDETSPLSVPAVIREIRGLGVDNLALSELLTDAGYDTAHAEEYEHRRFRLVESRIYTVDESFPRITRSSFSGGTVPAGVMRLRYTVDLTNEPPVPLDGEATEVIYERLACA